MLLFNISNITDDILSACYKLYVCVSLFIISYITDDILSARHKLAQYYLREFTEISLFSKDDKVPLPKLYVAMKWKRYTNNKIERQRPSYRSLQSEIEFYQYNQQQQQEESNLADFKDIFKKVGI